MRLHIIDQTDPTGNQIDLNDKIISIKICFEINSQESIEYPVDFYISPVSKNFKESLQLYLMDGMDDIEMRQAFVAKMTLMGEHMADALLGEDHPLIKISQLIKKNRYEHLDVVIESDREVFFQEPWELLVLPESPYVLSTTAKSFTRKLKHPMLETFADVGFDLHGSQQQTADVASMLGGQVSRDDPKPLKILLCQFMGDGKPVETTLGQYLFGQSKFTDAVDVKIIPFSSVKQLSAEVEVLCSSNVGSYHLLHIEGDLFIHEPGQNSSFGLSQISLDAIELARLVKKHHFYGVVFNFIHASQNKSLSAPDVNAAIHRFLQALILEGVGNVLANQFIATPRLVQHGLQHFYHQLVRGLSFAQSVIESRKAAQADAGRTLGVPSGLPVFSWPLLTHYSRGNLRFFKENHQEGAENIEQINALRSRLFGFQSEYLPPLLDHDCDLNFIELLSHFRKNTNPVLMCGKEGAGKTRLAHMLALYLAVYEQIDYCFYYDFEQDCYSPDDMLAMIAPVLEQEKNDLSSVLESVCHHRCFFVIDNFDQVQDISREKSDSLTEFFNQLSTAGQHVLFVTKRQEECLLSLREEFSSRLTQFHISAPALEEQKFLFRSMLESDSTSAFGSLSDRQLESLLATIPANPWLLKKITPLMISNELELFAEDCKRQFSSAEGKSYIQIFYDWRWQKLKEGEQILLTLCAQVPNLILDMMAMVFDRTEKFKPADDLLVKLDLDGRKFSILLKDWKRNGFLFQFPHGQLIDKRARSFICSFEKTDSVKKLSLQFYQVLCEAIRVLSRHVLSQPNQAVTNNLLFNRREWAIAMEYLWFAGDYRDFITCKSAFESLMTHHKLNGELDAWSNDLLSRSEQLPDERHLENAMVWLNLAASACQVTEGRSESLSVGATYWLEWLVARQAELHPDKLLLLQGVVRFLDRFYLAAEDYTHNMEVNEVACQIYRRFEAWRGVIQSWRSLALCNVKLNQNDEALKFENKILTEIHYESAPPGFKSQQMIEILLARASRGDRENVKPLFIQLRALDEEGRLRDLLDRIEQEIFPSVK